MKKEKQEMEIKHSPYRTREAHWKGTKGKTNPNSKFKKLELVEKQIEVVENDEIVTKYVIQEVTDENILKVQDFSLKSILAANATDLLKPQAAISRGTLANQDTLTNIIENETNRLNDIEIDLSIQKARQELLNSGNNNNPIKETSNE